MAQRVVWGKRALGDRAQLDVGTCQQIDAALYQFASGARADIKALKGQFAGQYRLRVGDWRVIYAPDWAHGEIYVLRVINRRESYR